VKETMLRRVSGYDQLWRQIDYRTLHIPAHFNLGVACVDDHDPEARALTLVHADRTSKDYTFGDLREQANRLANALLSLGIGRGDVVAIVNPASFETGLAFVALFRMGAIALPLSSLFGPDALSYRLRNGEAKAVITSSANAPKVREAVQGAEVPLLVIGEGAQPGEHVLADLLASAAADFAPVRTAAEDPAFLIFTSGTTGNPKGRFTRTESSSARSRASKPSTTSIPSPTTFSGPPRTGRGLPESWTSSFRPGSTVCR